MRIEKLLVIILSIIKAELGVVSPIEIPPPACAFPLVIVNPAKVASNSPLLKITTLYYLNK